MLQFLRTCAALALGLVVAAPALAQGYPTRPVKIVVPFAAGSATDIMARIIAEDLRASLGQPFIIDNKPGGSAQIGAELVAKSPPDGYTLFVTTNTSHSANPYLFKKLNYDPVKDFTPVANIMRIPVILVVNPAAKINSLAELVAFAKANPGKASFGYGNSIGQVVGASFAKQTGLEVITVPYKSTPQAITDLLGGQLTYAVADMASAQAFVKDGRLKALGISSNKRMAMAPDIPAIAEMPGLSTFEVIAWVGMFAPAGTPKDIVDRLNAAAVKVINQPVIKQRFADLSAEVIGSTPTWFGDYIKEDFARWAKVMKDAGIAAQ